MSDQVPTSDPNASPFPIARVELFNPKSSKLETNLVQAFEHPEDNNYIRNKVNNISISIITNAKSGRKMASYKLPKTIVERVVAGLQVNFPDVQIVNKVDSKDSNLHEVLLFWT